MLVVFVSVLVLCEQIRMLSDRCQENFTCTSEASSDDEDDVEDEVEDFVAKKRRTAATQRALRTINCRIDEAIEHVKLYKPPDSKLGFVCIVGAMPQSVVFRDIHKCIE